MNATKTPKPAPVVHIENLIPYQCQETDQQILLRLDSNTGPPGKWIQDLDLSALSICAYPTTRELESLIAEKNEIEPSQVLVTAGGDEGIDRVFRAYLPTGGNLLTTQPTFSMIPKYATMSGGTVMEIPWLAEEFPTEKLIQAADDSTSVVAIVSPNNPTGKTIEPVQLSMLFDALPGKLFLIDQAYAEFEDSMGGLTQFALNHNPNAVVIRTFSKAWGLAGIRVGYALGSQDVIDNLRKVGGPYTVATPSLALAKTALDHPPTATIDEVKSERTQLRQLFEKYRLKSIPSQANFVLLQLDENQFDANFLFRSLASQGILVRLFEQLNAVRITCPGNEKSFGLLTKKLDSILRPRAVLFDMDGVLVDEGPSYREAIRRTCLFFGQDFSLEEIAEKKLLGDANNDWIFTQRILAQRGCDVEFDVIKARFETIYQGNDSEPGIWDREAQLVDPTWLTELSLRYPLGVVTGRPRSDAERFLENAGIKQLFSTILCMEDGPAKPDPANVRTAMQNLKVESAWMIGDTPDDINAARSAGITSVGIIAPGDDPETTKPTLLDAGASAIVNQLSDLGELLP